MLWVDNRVSKPSESMSNRPEDESKMGRLEYQHWFRHKERPLISGKSSSTLIIVLSQGMRIFREKRNMTVDPWLESKLSRESRIGTRGKVSVKHCTISEIQSGRSLKEKIFKWTNPVGVVSFRGIYG